MYTSPSNKRYIGMTKNGLKMRALNGNGYKDSPKFWNAIKKYGWNNISGQVLFDNLTYQQACRLESICIDLFRTKETDYGYNIAAGGAGGGNPEFKKTVYSYSIFGEALKEYPSVTEVAKKYKVNISVVSSNCNENKQNDQYKKTIKNIVFSFEKLDDVKYFQENIDKYYRLKNKKTFTIYKCIKCGEYTACRKNRMCQNCYNKTKPERPNKEILEDLIYKYTFVDIGKMFNVADNTIRRWCKQYGLPSRTKDLYIMK